MKVALDLRPRSLIEQGKKRINFAGLLMTLLLLSFLLIGGATLGRSFLLFRSLQEGVAFLEETLLVQRAQNARLAGELARLAEEEAMYVSALKLLQDELPALEFLQAMEGALPLGVWVKTASMLPGKVSLQGSAFKEDDVVEFGKGLLDSPLVAAVDFPVTSRVVKDGQSLVDFSLACSIRDFASTIPPAEPVPSTGEAD